MAARTKVDDGGSARERILAAGRKLFAGTPYDEVAVHEIAREAGAAHGLLFHYFGSKLGLYLAVYTEDKTAFLKKRRLATSLGSPDQRLRRFVEFHFGHFHQWSATALFIHRGGAPAQIIAEAEKFRMLGVREVISYFSDRPATKMQLILGRAWLGFMGEIFVASIGDKRLRGEQGIEIVVEMFYEVMSRGSGLDLTNSTNRGETIPLKRRRAA